MKLISVDKTYPRDVEIERQLLQNAIDLHWEKVREDCRGLPPDAVRRRIDRASTEELSMLRNSLVGCELKANLVATIELETGEGIEPS